MITDFYAYWSEPDAKYKMRYELEKTWEISRRLNTWVKYKPGQYDDLIKHQQQINQHDK